MQIDDELEDDEMPEMPHNAPTDSASETDDDVMNESGTEAHCHGINGVDRAT